MNRLIVFFGITAAVLPMRSEAQQLKEILQMLPMADDSEGVEMKMPLESLLEIRPSLKKMGDLSGGGHADDRQDGMYFESENNSSDMEAVLYGITNGQLNQFYWSSKTKVTRPVVKEFRKQLRRKYNTPRLGYKARVTKEGVAKLVTEVFRVDDDGIVISLSSALGVTEIAVLNARDQSVDINELYFSYEKQKARLQAELTRLTGEPTKEEDPSNYSDLLASLHAELHDNDKGNDQQSPREVLKKDTGFESNESPAGIKPRVSVTGMFFVILLFGGVAFYLIRRRN